MTLVIGYTSPKSDCGFLLADNRECNSGERRDKIHLLDDRYAVAVTGQDSPRHALSRIEFYQRFEQHAPLSSVEELLEKFLSVHQLICESLFRAYMNGLQTESVTTELYQQTLNTTSTLVVLDMCGNALYQVDVGLNFPPHQLPEVLESTQLDADEVNFFGIEHGRESKSFSPTGQGIEQLRTEAVEIFRETREESEATAEIGELGTVAVYSNEAKRLHSAFDSVEDEARSSMANISVRD